MPRIFISYRQEDTSEYSNLLYGHLRFRYFCLWILGIGSVFRDRERLKAGEYFEQRIETELHHATVILVLIGKKWFDETNVARLSDPADFLRREIEFAFKNRKRIVPIYVDQEIGELIKKSRESSLPDDLKHLLERLFRVQGLGVKLHPVSQRRAGMKDIRQAVADKYSRATDVLVGVVLIALVFVVIYAVLSPLDLSNGIGDDPRTLIAVELTQTAHVVLNETATAAAIIAQASTATPTAEPPTATVTSSETATFTLSPTPTATATLTSTATDAPKLEPTNTPPATAMQAATTTRTSPPIQGTIDTFRTSLAVTTDYLGNQFATEQVETQTATQWTLVPSATEFPSATLTAAASPTPTTEPSPSPTVDTGETLVSELPSATFEPCFIPISVNANLAVYVGATLDSGEGRGNRGGLSGVYGSEGNVVVAGKFIDIYAREWWRLEAPSNTIDRELDRYWVNAIDAKEVFGDCARLSLVENSPHVPDVPRWTATPTLNVSGGDGSSGGNSTNPTPVPTPREIGPQDPPIQP